MKSLNACAVMENPFGTGAFVAPMISLKLADPPRERSVFFSYVMKL